MTTRPLRALPAAFALLAAACALLAVACALSACAHTGGGTSSIAPTVIHGELRYADLEEVRGLNPLLRTQASGTDLDMLVFGFFFNLDDKMRYVPELATEVPTYANGGISKDGRTLTYRLRRGVKWQDGAPFTSRDVVFTTQAILNPRNNVASRAGWDDIESVRAIGADRVQFRLKKIYAPAVATFFSESGLYPVLPAHLLERYPDINHVPFNDRPIGTGPFRLVKWVRGDRIELAANPSYWRGRPKLDGIVAKFVPTEAAILAQLKEHEVDAWFRPPASRYSELQDLRVYRVLVAPSLVYAHLDLDQRNPIFNDVRVRRAINYALDKKAIVDRAAGGLADLAATDVSPLSWAYDPHAERYPHDPRRARVLLAEAGWTAGSGGTLEKDGKPLAFAISAVSGAPVSQAIEDLIRQQLREVGIDASVKNYPSGPFFASFGDGGILYRGKYDAALFSWVAGVDPDDSSEYMCDEIPPAGQNDMYWCDPALDAAERGALSTYARETRKKYYAITQEELAAQSATIFLYFARQVFVVSPQLRGFIPAPATSSYWNTWEWSI